ncbi:MAG TPA: DUF488 domain-containing protein [Thermoplasmata archaeon]|nr:DUF488 domain-containing protein [Thermoplasmata archaeon]
MLAPEVATVWTIGHSTRGWEEFLALLQESDIVLLVDVRHYPSSARVPWTNAPVLAKHLADAGLGYEHLDALGGYRKPRPGSRNAGWRNPGFRGYADYMDSEAFLEGVRRLVERAKTHRTAIMCAEAVPWRCHRNLLADALTVRGVRVIHILSPGKTQDHSLTPFARVHGERLTYPARGTKRK